MPDDNVSLKKPQRGKNNPLYFFSLFMAALIAYISFSWEFSANAPVSQQPSVLESNVSIPSSDLNKTYDESNTSATIQDHVKISGQKPSSIIMPQKGQLVIVIDDMRDPDVTHALDQLPFDLTYSFFPLSDHVTQSDSLVKTHPHSLVHLPLEAYRYKDELPTLQTTDSEEDIRRVIATIRHDFPSVKIINNHTGSKFTSDREAMQRLLRVLKEFDFMFLDSKTASKTVVADEAKKLGVMYYERDVFLDDDPDIDVIKGQIREAVNTAKGQGFCIAIGHPRPHTIQALKESKALLSSVTMVKLDELIPSH